MSSQQIVAMTAREVDGRLVLLDAEHDALRSMNDTGDLVRQFLSASGDVDRDLKALLGASLSRDGLTLTFTLPIAATPEVDALGGRHSGSEVARRFTVTASRAKWRNSSKKRLTAVTVDSIAV